MVWQNICLWKEYKIGNVEYVRIHMKYNGVYPSVDICVSDVMMSACHRCWIGVVMGWHLVP